MIRDMRTYSPRLRSYIRGKRLEAAGLYSQGRTPDEIADTIGHSLEFTRSLLQHAIGRSEA